jgi:hypothetical protein
MGCNFDPDHVWEARNMLREEETEGDGRSPAQIDWDAIGPMLFRVLREFPEAVYLKAA